MLPGAIGLLQTTEVIKMVLGHGDPMIGRLLLYDAMKMSFREVKVRRDTGCILCWDQPSITELIDYKEFCNVPLPGEVLDTEFDESAYEISPVELKKTLQTEEGTVLLDVRESYEWEICHLNGARLHPLSEFKPEELEIPKNAPVVLYCYMGRRSLTALREMRNAGFTNLRNLAGGIDLWAEEVEPEMPRY